MYRLAAIFLLLASQLQAADINVRDFGAVPDDGKDDTAAFQKAINFAAEGQIIRIPPGMFEISQMLDPREGRIIQGATTLRWQDPQTLVAENQTILKSTREQPMFYYRGTKGFKLQNLTFQGRVVYADRENDEMPRGLVVDNCWFDLQIKGDERPNGIEFSTGLADSKITNNVFDPTRADNAIYGYNWHNLVIANNHFKNGNEGIHVIAHNDQSRDLLIEQNYFSGLHRMAAEVQGGGYDTIVQDNYYENPVMTPNFDDNNDTFAFSIIADRSHGTRVRRNTSIAPQRPDGKGVRIIFELGGTDVICEDNFSRQGNQVAILNTSKFGKIINNRFRGYLEGPSAYGGRALDPKIENNAPDTPLTWDVDRGKPGPNKRLPTTRSAP